MRPEQNGSILQLRCSRNNYESNVLHVGCSRNNYERSAREKLEERLQALELRIRTCWLKEDGHSAEGSISDKGGVSHPTETDSPSEIHKRKDPSNGQFGDWGPSKRYDRKKGHLCHVD